MGKGNVFQPTYRDRHGELKHSRTWWIYYYSDGRLIRENAKTTDERKARRLLTIRQGELAKGEEPVTPEVNRCLMTELFALVVEDYRINELKSIGKVESRVRLHLGPFFGKMKARQVTGAHVQAFIAARKRTPTRKRPGASNAEINRELAIVSRAFTLGRKFRKVTVRPEFETLEENNARQGFFEDHQIEAVWRLLPHYLKPALLFGSITGWRSHSEVFALEWRQVDFAAGEIRLDAGQTKNKKGRVFPLTEELRVVLEAQRAHTDALQRKLGAIVPLVFHRNGKRIKDYYTAWDNACTKAGCPSLLFHDLRRTAVRNLTRAGVPQPVAKAMTGHKTDAVFHRYDIVSPQDLQRAAEQLDTFKELSKTRRAQLDRATGGSAK